MSVKFISTRLLILFIQSLAQGLLLLSPSCYAQALENNYFCSQDFKHLLINLAKRQDTNPKNRVYELSGWLDLIKINESSDCKQPTYYQQQQQSNHELLQWFYHYSNHPAAYFFPKLFNLPSSNIKKIAILLPLNDKYRPYTSQLIDYIKERLKANSIDIKHYNTASANPIDLYKKALNEQSDCVIGPLIKKNINTLSQIPISIPVLALNPIGNNVLSPSKFFQLAKKMDSEVKQLIQILDNKNYHRGILLYPENNPKLQHIANAISTEFVKHYGEWISIKSYHKNYNQLVKSTLNIEQSITRYQQLKNTLAGKFKFIPRRRKDIDFIILLGSAKQIQQVYPQIKYWFADNVPVYTTSSIASFINAKTIIDLSGINYISPLPENKLDTIANQAVDLVVKSQCFRLENIYNKNSMWEFIPDKGVFLYKSRF